MRKSLNNPKVIVLLSLVAPYTVYNNIISPVYLSAPLSDIHVPIMIEDQNNDQSVKKLPTTLNQSSANPKSKQNYNIDINQISKTYKARRNPFKEFN